MRLSWVAVCAGVLLWFLGIGPVLADGQIECTSEGYRYRYCRVDTDNSVRLAHQQSKSSCDFGRGWGYDRRGIWVDNGCSAIFEYGYGSGGDRGRGRDRDRNDTGKIVAGVAAIAILGAIASSHERSDRHRDDDNWRDRVPGWAVGSFSGNDRLSGMEIDVNVDPNGRIGGYYGHRSLDGQFDGDRAYLGGRGYSAYATRDGFQLVADDDRRTVIDFYRD
jgi:hypothetical protein